jgi:hypothetical protein
MPESWSADDLDEILAHPCLVKTVWSVFRRGDVNAVRYATVRFLFALGGIQSTRLGPVHSLPSQQEMHLTTTKRNQFYDERQTFMTTNI